MAEKKLVQAQEKEIADMPDWLKAHSKKDCGDCENAAQQV